VVGEEGFFHLFFEVWLNLQALVQAKKAAGRPKDLLMLPELEGLLEASQEE
jgi:hypothetical protein